MIEIVCIALTIIMAIILYFVKIYLDNMKKDIVKLYSIVEKNKKEIIGIRNDMTDYFNFENYNYDDD